MAIILLNRFFEKLRKVSDSTTHEIKLKKHDSKTSF